MGGGSAPESPGPDHRQVSRREDRPRDDFGVVASMKVHGSLRVPGDKSISHRSLILSAIANGESRIRGLLQSADVHSTAGVLRALGARIPELAPEMSVVGAGLRGLAQ